MKRPRIVIIPNLAAWIIGEMSRHIIGAFRESYDFYFVPESLVYWRPDLVSELLSGASLVHCMNESGASLLVRKLGSEPLPPMVTWIHHVTSWSPDHELAARHSCAITACTPGWGHAIEELDTYGTPVHVIRHGVDTDFFQPRSGTRAQFGIPPDAFVIGFVAHGGSNTDNNRKGFPTLLEIIKAAAPRIPNLYLLMLGPGWEDPVRELQAAGVRARYIDFLPRSAVPNLFAALDVYLLTSRVEGGPCTVLEAMACATPVVATRVGLVPDVLRDSVNGFSAEVDDPRSLAEAVIALASDRGKALEIGAQGRATSERHTWARNLTPLGEVYKHYSRPPKVEPPLRSWMADPNSLTGPAHAADVIVNAWDRLRKHPGAGPIILRTSRYGMEGVGFADQLRGLAMLKRLTFRTDFRTR